MVGYLEHVDRQFSQIRIKEGELRDSFDQKMDPERGRPSFIANLF